MSQQYRNAILVVEDVGYAELDPRGLMVSKDHSLYGDWLAYRLF